MTNWNFVIEKLRLLTDEQKKEYIQFLTDLRDMTDSSLPLDGDWREPKDTAE